MKTDSDIRCTQQMLREAMELLEDTRHHMAMFQRQRYGKLKTRFEQHEALGEPLQKALNAIETK